MYREKSLPPSVVVCQTSKGAPAYSFHRLMTPLYQDGVRFALALAFGWLAGWLLHVGVGTYHVCGAEHADDLGTLGLPQLLDEAQVPLHPGLVVCAPIILHTTHGTHDTHSTHDAHDTTRHAHNRSVLGVGR
jgi:hypothetical protein